MPGKPITSIPWDDLVGKWILVEHEGKETPTSNGGALGRVKALTKGEIFGSMICNPYYNLNTLGASVFEEDRLLIIQRTGWIFTVYDDIMDMKDDVMIAFLASKKTYPPILLALENKAFRDSLGIEASPFVKVTIRMDRMLERFRDDQP